MDFIMISFTLWFYLQRMPLATSYNDMMRGERKCWHNLHIQIHRVNHLINKLLANFGADYE
jgi:hypothetical protein